MESADHSDFLDRIESPSDLRGLEIGELKKLAGEIRARIIEIVARSGGHLASSLGAIELTLALHKVFDTPRDKVIFDVGHQSYAHKIITGRNRAMDRLRQADGPSGFPHPLESDYDEFIAGHAGNSISVALGLAKARDLREQDRKIIALIGDGALGAGMALEALNHAGASGADLIVALNDNKMSISPNVGAISNYLNRLITGRWYTRFRSELDPLVESVIGGRVAGVAKRLEEGLKGAFAPSRLFEELGFKYVGPIDGHELTHLVDTFERIRQLKGPILAHIVTTKGKGYKPAEKMSQTYHGVLPFEPASGVDLRIKPCARTYSDIFAETIVELAAKDDRIVAITAAMKEGTGLTRFAERFPDRYFDVGIAEQHAVTFAAGLAKGGLKPVVAIYSTFLQRAFDQMIHDVGISGLDVTFAIDRAGVVGSDGVTHQGAFDISYLGLIPKMTIMAPKDAVELEWMIEAGINTDGPVAIRYARGVAERINNSHAQSRAGAELLRDGTDILLVAVGSMVSVALETASLLSERASIEAAVINARYVKPIDIDTIARAGASVRDIVTLEEGALAGGFGSALGAALSEGPVAARVGAINLARVGIPDIYLEHGAQDQTRRSIGLDVDALYAKVIDLLAERDRKEESRRSSRSPNPNAKLVG